MSAVNSTTEKFIYFFDSVGEPVLVGGERQLMNQSDVLVVQLGDHVEENLGAR